MNATLCIPTFNRRALVARAVDSALAEAEANAGVEVLVLDNASSDGTYAMLRSRYGKRAKLRLLRNPRDLGMVGNWNKGLRLAKGRYFALLSDDDLLLPGFLGAGLAAHAACPGAGFSFGAFRLMDAQGRLHFTHRPLGRRDRILSGAEAWAWIFYYYSPITLATALFDRDKLRALGGFRERAWYAADGDAYLRLASRHPAAYLGAALAGYGYHPGNLQQAMRGAEMAKVLEFSAASVGLPEGMKDGAGLRGRLKALLRARYEAGSALALAAGGRRAEAKQRLEAALLQAGKLKAGAAGARLALARLALLPALGRAVCLGVRALHFLRRRGALPYLSPAACVKRVHESLEVLK